MIIVALELDVDGSPAAASAPDATVTTAIDDALAQPLRRTCWRHWSGFVEVKARTSFEQPRKHLARPHAVDLHFDGQTVQ